MTTSEEITLTNGRRVAAHFPARGESGRTVVLCHSAPGSGGFDPDPEETAARGATLLGVDRPGYGGSEPMPAGEWASVAAAADDLAEVLDQLGTGPVGVAGWSAGGRVALALAARRPDLVGRVAVGRRTRARQVVPAAAARRPLRAGSGNGASAGHPDVATGAVPPRPTKPSRWCRWPAVGSRP